MNKKTDSKPPLGYLQFTVFITGAVVMILELLGTKIIAPFYGSTVLTWTALIATTLISLSLGYHYGGRWADQTRSENRLYKIIFIAGVFLLLVPLIQFPVLKATASLGLRAGVLSSSFIFFAFPLFLLGMATPFAIKLSYREETKLGGMVGSLYAISTLGSLIGTLLTGFFLIPYFDNLKILIGCSGALFFVSWVYFMFFSKLSKIKVLSLYFLTMCFFVLETSNLFLKEPSPVATKNFFYKLTYRGNSNYGNLRVLDAYDNETSAAPLQREIYTDGFCQNRMDLKTRASLHLFSYVLKAFIRSHIQKPESVLCIGTGAGILPMEFSENGAQVDAVEINPQILFIAKQYFNFSDEKVHVSLMDGRYFLHRSTKKYDAIILDALLGDSVPTHLISVEMIQMMREHLNPRGVLAINFFGKRANDVSVNAFYTTLKKVFPFVQAYSLNRSGVTNIYFCASEQEPLTQLPLEGIPAFFMAKIEEVFSSPLQCLYDEALLLTDQYNPIDLWNLTNREEIRRRIQASSLIELIM